MAVIIIVRMAVIVMRMAVIVIVRMAVIVIVRMAVIIIVGVRRSTNVHGECGALRLVSITRFAPLGEMLVAMILIGARKLFF